MLRTTTILFSIFLLVTINYGCQKMGDASQSTEFNPTESADRIFESPSGTVMTRAASDNRFIDLENASLSSSKVLTDGGFTYPFIVKGTYNNPSLTTSERFRGCNSIIYSMPPTTASGSVTNDKSQHRIFSGADPNALGLGEKKYFGMALKLDANMPQNTSSVQFFQIWQGTPMSPPLEMRLMPGGSSSTFKYEVRIRNNQTTANPSAGTPIYSGTMVRGQWNTFVLMTVLRTINDSQDGEIKLWQNGVQKIQWFGRCGYDNGIIYAGSANTPNPNFDSFFGPYRPCQNVSLKMYFDEVRYGGSFSETSPDNVVSSCPL
jgi:hypothetical protein